MKKFDFECPDGHVFEECFGHLDPLPEALPCPVCKQAGSEVLAPRIKVYGLAPVRCPTSSTTYSRD